VPARAIDPLLHTSHHFPSDHINPGCEHQFTIRMLFSFTRIESKPFWDFSLLSIGDGRGDRIGKRETLVDSAARNEKGGGPTRPRSAVNSETRAPGFGKPAKFRESSNMAN
jgi:hypothetical protein